MSELEKLINNEDYANAYYLICTKQVVCNPSLLEEIRIRVEGVVCVTDRTFKHILVKMGV